MDALRKGRSRVLESGHTVDPGLVAARLLDHLRAGHREREPEARGGGDSGRPRQGRDGGRDPRADRRHPDHPGDLPLRQSGGHGRSRHRQPSGIAQHHPAAAGRPGRRHADHQGAARDHQQPEPAAGAVPRGDRDPRSEESRRRHHGGARRGRAGAGSRPPRPGHRADLPPGGPLGGLPGAAGLRRRRDLLQGRADARRKALRGAARALRRLLDPRPLPGGRHDPVEPADGHRGRRRRPGDRDLRGRRHGPAVALGTRRDRRSGDRLRRTAPAAGREAR